MRRVISDQRGMTLAEVLVALPIITIGLLALLSAIPLSTYATQDGRQTSTATFLANQRLEQVRNAQWSATCHVDPVTLAVGPGADVIDTLGVSASSTAAPKDPSNAVTFADESPMAAPYTAYSRQVRITASVAGAPTCTSAGVMSGTGIRRVTVTVSYTPLSATGTNAVSGTRAVSVTMQVAQK
ncbi:MAG TPA: prepilin-type N-terminal cleavage/methylation domain-containing protein [Gemmatimonadales bacterium]|jgi:prepilin-type N-terminal cleavage/methylation domain-containing protein|nr:prepilin-type N-terminal cleavage/methylation domain-containing protein [Gemmatimonadales bacterium]